jgi:hypothetical protein
MVTTNGPLKAPAGLQGIEVMNMETFLPSSMWRTGTPAWSSAVSNEKLHPSRNATRSGVQTSSRSVTSRTSFPSR